MKQHKFALVALVAIFLIIAAIGSVRADYENRALSAVDLYEICTKADMKLASLCTGYVQGFLDAVDTALAKVANGEWCFEESTVDNIADNYVMFYKVHWDHPTVIDVNGSAVKSLYKSVDWAYTCPD